MQPVLVSASDEIIIRRTYNPKLGPFAKNNVVIDEWNLDDYFLRLDGSNTMVGPINFEEAKVSQPPPTEIVFKDNKGFLKGILAPTLILLMQQTKNTLTLFCRKSLTKLKMKLKR